MGGHASPTTGEQLKFPPSLQIGRAALPMDFTTTDPCHCMIVCNELSHSAKQSCPAKRCPLCKASLLQRVEGKKKKASFLFLKLFSQLGNSLLVCNGLVGV